MATNTLLNTLSMSKLHLNMHWNWIGVDRPQVYCTATIYWVYLVRIVNPAEVSIQVKLNGTASSFAGFSVEPLRLRVGR